MTNPKKPDTQTDDIGRDLTPALGPELVLLEQLALYCAGSKSKAHEEPQALCQRAYQLIRQQAAQLAEAQAELERVRGLKLAAEGVNALHAKGEIRGSQQGFYALMALRAATAPAGGES